MTSARATPFSDAACGVRPGTISHRSMPPDPIDLLDFARLEESRQAYSVARIADEFEPIAGGTMCFGGAGSWANQAMGMGMNGPVLPADLDRLIAYYEPRGVEAKVELCPFADVSLVRGLAERGFVVREFENVLALGLRNAELSPVPVGIEIQRVDPSDEQRVQIYLSITRDGFAPTNPEQYARLERRMLRAPGTLSFMALIDGEPAAAGSCEVAPPCAALFGLTTLARFRRRGCQRALMIVRLRAAIEAGCRYASIHSRPDVATGRNAMRLCFQVAFTKAILARPGPGLEPSP